MKPTQNRFRRIAHNTFYLGLSETVARFSTLILIAFLGRHWAVSLYGQYAVAINWVAIFAVAAELGLNALTVREVSYRKTKAVFFLRHVLVLRSSLSFLFWGTLIGISLALHYETILTMAMGVLGLRLILDSMEGGYLYLFQAHQEMGPYAMVNILCAAIRLIGIILVVAAGAQIIGACSIWVVASGVGFIVMMTLGYRRGWKPSFSEYRLDDSWKVLKMAFPLAAFGALQTLYYRVDSVILKSLSGNESVAYYDMATRVLLYVLSMSQLYSQAVFPVFSSVQDKPGDFSRFAFKCSKFLFFLGLPLMVGGYFLANSLLVLIAGPQYASSGPAFAILALSILPFFLANIYVDILAIKNTARLNFQFIFLFLLNVILNFIFIPRWQFVGAAWATVICEYLGVFAGFLLAAPYLKHMGKVSWGRPLTASLASCLIMGIGLYYAPHLYWLVLGPIVYAIGLVAFRALDSEDWASLKSILRISN